MSKGNLLQNSLMAETQGSCKKKLFFMCNQLICEEGSTFLSGQNTIHVFWLPILEHTLKSVFPQIKKN